MKCNNSKNSVHKKSNDFLMRIILLGPQGCGKGTQAKKISEKYNLPHISTGDIFRYNIKNQTTLGKEALTYIDEGNLVPDSLTNKIVEDRLKDDDCKKGFVLDGYPRNIAQGKALMEMSDIDFAFNIDISDETTVRRLSGRRSCSKGHVYHVEFNPSKEKGVCDVCGLELFQRDDDKPETIKKRLEIYHEETSPLIEFYKKKGKLVEVDGEQKIEKVFEEIIDVLD